MNDPAEDAEPSELSNKSVIKAAALLTELGRHPRGITVTELGQKVRMSRPTTFRLLLSLEQTGFVERNGNNYVLGWKIARLGRLADPNGGIIARVQPIMTALADRMREMIGYAVVNGDGEFDLVAEASSDRLITLSQGYVGREFPLHASATGKLVLAALPNERIETLLPRNLPRMASRTIVKRVDLLNELEQVRSQDFAVVDDELEESLFALAVPVRDEADRFVGVLAATGPTQRMKSYALDDLVAQLRDSAAEISTRLHRGVPPAI